MPEEEDVSYVKSIIDNYNIAKKQKDFDLYKFCVKNCEPKDNQ